MKLEILVSWEAILCRDSFVRGDRAVEGSFVLLSLGNVFLDVWMSIVVVSFLWLFPFQGCGTFGYISVLSSFFRGPFS